MMMMMMMTVMMMIMMRVVMMRVMMTCLRKPLLSQRAVGPGARRSLGERRLKSTAWSARRSSQEGRTVPANKTQAEEHHWQEAAHRTHQAEQHHWTECRANTVLHGCPRHQAE